MKSPYTISAAVFLIAGLFMPQQAGARSPQKISCQAGIRNRPAEKKFVNDNVVDTSYSVGDFVHGGIVFWIDETGQHGLVCTKTDQSAGVRWYAGTYTYTMALSDGPLAGKMNTSLIIASQGRGDGKTYAARICNELQITEGGKTYGDWYLPSKQELNLMYENKTRIDATANANGGTAFAREHNSSYYWSSNEGDRWNWGTPYFAWRQRFSSASKSTYGSQYHYTKNHELRVRAVRAF